MTANFLRGNPDLEDTIKRLQAFERAGADVLFAPGSPDLKSVGAVHVFREGKLFVAHAPELDVSGAGKTVDEAKAHLVEAVEAFVEEAHRMGTLSDILEEADYERTPGGWRAPDLLAQERARVALPG